MPHWVICRCCHRESISPIHYDNFSIVMPRRLAQSKTKIIKKCVCDECCQNSSYKNFKKSCIQWNFLGKRDDLKQTGTLKNPQKIIFKSIILQHSKRIISKLFCCCTNEEKKSKHRLSQFPLYYNFNTKTFLKQVKNKQPLPLKKITIISV